MFRGMSVAAALGLIAAAGAQDASPALAGVAFLVGDWQAGDGRVAETGGTAAGRSSFALEAGGNVLLRRDHTDLATAAGKAAGSFEQIMMIYPEGGTLHADYSDGRHVIHYSRADIVAGRSVVFSSSAVPDAPTFRLEYRLVSPHTLSVSFGMAAPGSADFRPVATGTLTRGG